MRWSGLAIEQVGYTAKDPDFDRKTNNKAVQLTVLMSASRRHYAYYLGLVAVLAVYRPSISGVSDPAWLTATLCAGILLLLAAVLRRRTAAFIEVGPIVTRKRRHWLAELSVYAALALGMLLVDTLWLGQAPLSVLRYAALALVFGHLASIDTTLTAIRTWLDLKDDPFSGKYRMLPTVGRLWVLPASMVVALTALLALALYVFACSPEAADQGRAFRRFAIDAAFALLVVTGMSLIVIRSYAANLKTLIDQQVQILRDIQTGDLSGAVPVVSFDSFGLLASQINRVAEYLRERDRVYDVLKRIVSPSIMEKLVSTDSATLKQGQECQLAILFCDIRGFTRASERSSAGEMILFLNSYFADMSELISAHEGIINKFLGDGLLAVFGIDDPEGAVCDAYQAASDIVAHSEGFTLPDGSTPETGVGLHFGTVIAGTVGSEYRFEYTFLGDPVNTASRLEGLSKRLGYRIIVSADAYEALPREHREQLDELGLHRVRGKTEAVRVYGAGKSAPRTAPDQG